MGTETDPEYPVVASIKLGDRLYELLCRKCDVCNDDHYQVFRFCGPTFACYRFPHELDLSSFEDFVRQIDEKLLQSSHEMLRDFELELQKINSPAGIEANHSMEFLLAEYARQRLAILKDMGMLDALYTREGPTSEAERALRLAFELGAAVSEHKVMSTYEEYFWDGVAMAEWRESGLPKAREERLRQGARTREAIMRAAKRLYQTRPELIRNDTETAREIQKMKLPELRRGDEHQLGTDAITKHLRSARRTHFPLKAGD
jgi:hypothetical protein